MSTVLAPETLADAMAGQHVRLYPYLRGHWPPETFATLWQAMRADGALEKVFWPMPPATTPFSMQGDLVAFVRYFEPEPPQRRHLLIAQRLDQPAEIAGLVWFDDFVGNRAAANIWYRRRSWGHPAREASRLALHYAFGTWDVSALWAYTPWPIAARHAEAAGFEAVARLPGYVKIDGRPQDLVILRLTREAFHGQQ